MTRFASTTSLLSRAISPVVKTQPSWADLRAFANKVAADRGEWGGAPLPMNHVKLVMEPRYPFKKLQGAQFGQEGEKKPEGLPAEFQVINRWFDYRRGVFVCVCRRPDGKSETEYIRNGAGQRLEFWLNTLGVYCGKAWDLATEERALTKLRQLVSEHAFNCYRMVGGFLETSKRSGVQYLFRKLRPTIALKPDRGGSVQALAVLCLHPLGYYADSWAGVMCPTDDVVAHLMMMRACEHQFWKKANHHNLSMASAGV